MNLGPIQTRWVESLEAHPERQGKGRLGIRDLATGEYRACCLGEGGLIAGVCKWDGEYIKTISNSPFYLSEEAYAALGLRNQLGAFISGPHEVGSVTVNSLADANDEGATWSEIAAFIRANPEEIFKESV